MSLCFDIESDMLANQYNKKQPNQNDSRQEEHMNAKVKTVKQVCKCENCGNESEMMITCTLEELDSDDRTPAAPHDHNHPKQAKGSATCTNCGNEADMWVDI